MYNGIIRRASMSTQAEETTQERVDKKIYSPPQLTKYGKLVEITAGGTGKNPEMGNPADRFKRP